MYSKLLGLIFLVKIFIIGCAPYAKIYLPAVPHTGPKETVAVMYFVNLAQGDVDLSEEIHTAVNHVFSLFQQFSLVERVRIKDVLKEIRFSMSDLMDPHQVQMAGRLLGARYIVLGSYRIRKEKFHIMVRMVKVETAEIKGIWENNGPLKKQKDVIDGLKKMIYDGLKM